MSRRVWLVAIGSAIAAGAATLVAVNLSSGAKEIREKVTHTYAIADPQFLRSMSVLLGPPVVGGNHVETLLNGDQIFPAMLKAMEGAKKTITFLDLLVGRSLRLKDEANLNVYSRPFADRAIAVFDDDLKRSRRITYQEWLDRPWSEKLAEYAEGLVDAQL